MFDDDFIFKLTGVLLFIIGLFIALFIVTLNDMPDKIKDTNCIYYEEQIYCLQENEVKE